MLILTGFLNVIILAQLVQKTVVIIHKRNQLLEDCLKLLWNKGLIVGYKCTKGKIKIFLKYKNNRAIIDNLSVVSNKINNYYSIKQIWKINSGKSIIFFFNKPRFTNTYRL